MLIIGKKISENLVKTSLKCWKQIWKMLENVEKCWMFRILPKKLKC